MAWRKSKSRRKKILRRLDTTRSLINEANEATKHVVEALNQSAQAMQQFGKEYKNR